ncbi:formamidopyrimidine-DNA glycosylase [Halanaerobium saccharolyticum]|uniref:Formamidopyrimidine-DNA glycosylase n=1 Tax=Halanaerobium saccharolyticum TaxID=43595 RepID=A0A4R6LEQ9_9FIRM|nr:DNA-formamidopyrimidine glycosylase family protein [Halanaerobium saccharolyticum]TDO73400.1 formamidopyrimidine-DNA glycosylase [Halanaerobium saccharolyticum]
MPELPDVELFKKYLDSTSLHQTISRVDILNEDIIKCNPESLRDKLEKNSFQKSHRYGKYLFIKITNIDFHLVLHFGMTGFLKYYKNQEKKPDHIRVLFSFANNYKLAYDNQRLLGEVNLTHSINSYLKEKELGPDALEIDFSNFKEILKNRKAAIKAVIMDQNKIAGIGNIYADEILYQNSIHPEQQSNTLSRAKIKKLYQTMQDILKIAIKYNAEPDNFPDDWIIPHRKEGELCPRCGGNIKRIKVYGRGTYICPECQSID